MNQNTIKDYLDDITKWRFWGRWKFSLFSQAPYNTYKTSSIFKRLQLPDEFTGNMVNMYGYVYAFEDDHQTFDAFILPQFAAGFSWFENYFTLCAETLDRANKLKEDNDLVACLHLMADLSCLTDLVHFCDKALESVVPEVALASGLNSETFSKLLVPYKPTYAMQYKEALRKLDRKDVPAFLEEYKWMGTSYLDGKRLTEKDVMDELGKLSKENDLTQAAPVDMSAIPSLIKSKIMILQKLIYYRSVIAEIFSKIINLQWGAFDILAAQHGYTRSDFNFMTPKEVIMLYEKGIVPSDFPERLKSGDVHENGVSCVDGEEILYFGDKLKEKLKIFTHTTTGEQKSVSGRIAFKGKVTGKVRIVQNTLDLEKIQEGDIIVSPETMPDYIVGMQKAAAFVTNQGGITSHAAIVARELKKPCIIGTKIATLIFKDGDMVEVDADKGVVTLL